MDVFLLDVLCEILASPLYFLSFIHRRAHFSDRLVTSSELAVLGFHVSQNLWFDDEYDMVNLGEDFCAHIDTIMLGRRTEIVADDLPQGILTRYEDTLFGSLIKQIERGSDSKMIDLGFLLLAASSQTADEISQAINFTFKRARQTAQVHDFTIAFGDSGLTAHCGTLSTKETRDRLVAHCELAKYRSQADTWYGLALSPIDKGEIKVAIGISHTWRPDPKMDNALRYLSKPPSKSVEGAMRAPVRRVKIGANAQCPCGSGKKYKKCCRPR